MASPKPQKAKRKNGARTSAGDKKVAQLRAILRHRADLMMKRLEACCGPAFSVSEASQLLKIGAGKVRSMDRRGQLIGLSRAGQRQYPAWQFNRGKVRTWVKPLISKVGGSRSALHFLTIPRSNWSRDGKYQQLLAYLLSNDPKALARLREVLEQQSIEFP